MIYHSLHSEFVYRTVGEALQNITPGLWVITSIEVKIKGFTCVSLPCNDQPLSHSLPILQSQCLFRNLWQREWPRFIIHQSSTQLGVFCKGAHRAKLYMECRFGGFGGSGDCGVGSRGGGRLQQRRRVGVLFGGVGTSCVCCILSKHTFQDMLILITSGSSWAPTGSGSSGVSLFWEFNLLGILL